MHSYYRSPFAYNRNSMNIPGVEATLPQAVSPAMPTQNQPVMPITQPMIPATKPMLPYNEMMPAAPMQYMQPVMPTAPMQNIQPVQYMMPMPNMQPMMPISPMQNMQPMMPMQCPYANFPMMPGMGTNMGLPAMGSHGMGFPAMGTGEDMADMEETTSMTAEADRVPIVSNNPPVVRISLFKEQTAYPNYGNPSGNADILYRGDRGVWTFQIPNYLFQQGNWRGELVIRTVLDDHYNTPANRYSARITVNNDTVHTGRVPAEHGTPSGGRFTNWRELTFRVPDLRRNNRVVIVNTSENIASDDWIAFDWMELRLFPR
jgi:hypothetical protein